MDLGLATRSAIVTGGARGIGRAVSERLAAEGARVLVADLDPKMAADTARRIRQNGGSARSCAVDVRRPGSVARMVQTAIRWFDAIDILVNNAGVGRSSRVADMTTAEWHLVLEVNLTGAFLCARAVYPWMQQRGAGRIVNMASMAGRATSTVGGAHYTASKAGLLGLSRHLAREWAADAITVNAVSPGIIDTPMLRADTDARRRASLSASIPLRRLGEPEEIAALVCFLASDEAAYITGANVDIHGGELIIA
jgi:NAD(P)-dependent dehydrogenase (short-subunit alcohol dehydrogenase family)